MPQTMQEFLARKVDPSVDGDDICPKCKEVITIAQKQAEDVRMTKEGLVHADCYFEELGEAVDAHPIGRGRPHGGCT